MDIFNLWTIADIVHVAIRHFSSMSLDRNGRRDGHVLESL